MTELTPLYMDINNAYSGDEFGLPWRDVVGEGIVGAADLLVSAGAGNSINIAAGSAWVVGDTNVNLQPTYRVYNDGVVNKGITPDPSNPRIVLVVAQITDAGFSGTQRNWAINPIHGTPAGAPTTPATPASAFPLCSILVPAAAPSSAAYVFTDLRTRAAVGGGQATSSVPADVSRLLYDSTLGAPAASFDVQNIAQTFPNLRIVAQLRGSNPSAAVDVLVRFNNDATAIYDDELWSAKNTVAGLLTAEVAQTRWKAGVAAAANAANGQIASTVEIVIPMYQNSTWEKTVMSSFAHHPDYTAANQERGQTAGFWRSVAAINRVTVFPSAGNWSAASRLLIYGF